jgi:hypothetical protein
MALLHWRNFWIPAWVTKTSLNPWPCLIRPSDVHPFAAARRHRGHEGGTEPSRLARTAKNKRKLDDVKLQGWLNALLNGLQPLAAKYAAHWVCPRCWKCYRQKDPFLRWSLLDATADKMTTRHDEIYSQYPPMYIHARQITDFEILLDYSHFI